VDYRPRCNFLISWCNQQTPEYEAMKATRLLGPWLTWSLFFDAYTALFVAVLQSLPEGVSWRSMC